jgi:hypothetical protein
MPVVVLKRMVSSVVSSRGSPGEIVKAEKEAPLVSDISCGESKADENGTTIRKPSRVITDAQNRAQFRYPPFFCLLRALKGSNQNVSDLRNNDNDADAPSGRESLANGSVRLISLMITATKRV